MSEILQAQIDALQPPRSLGSVASVGDLAVWATGIRALAEMPYDGRGTPTNRDVAESIEVWLTESTPGRQQPTPPVEVSTETIRPQLFWLTKLLILEANAGKRQPGASALKETARALQRYAGEGAPSARTLLRAGRGDGKLVRQILAEKIFGRELK